MIEARGQGPMICRRVRIQLVKTAQVRPAVVCGRPDDVTLRDWPHWSSCLWMTEAQTSRHTHTNPSLFLPLLPSPPLKTTRTQSYCIVISLYSGAHVHIHRHTCTYRHMNMQTHAHTRASSQRTTGCNSTDLIANVDFQFCDIISGTCPGSHLPSHAAQDKCHGIFQEG